MPLRRRLVALLLTSLFAALPCAQASANSAQQASGSAKKAATSEGDSSKKTSAQAKQKLGSEKPGAASTTTEKKARAEKPSAQAGQKASAKKAEPKSTAAQAGQKAPASAPKTDKSTAAQAGQKAPARAKKAGSKDTAAQAAQKAQAASSKSEAKQKAQANANQKAPASAKAKAAPKPSRPEQKAASKAPARVRNQSKTKTAQTGTSTPAQKGGKATEKGGKKARQAAVQHDKGAPRRKHPNPYLEVPPLEVTQSSPAYIYANLTNEEAFAELDRRGIPHRREEPGPAGVRAPIRLTGALHGVEVHSSLPPAQRTTTHFEVLDARLALALDDFCALLAEHDIVEVVHYTMYRHGVSPRAESDSLPTRHPGGLAIDVGALRYRNGRWLDVREVWSLDIGKKTCGAGAKHHDDERAQTLVGLVCDAAAKRLFHYMLTPHFDEAHHDHLHLEIKPAVKWFLVN